MLIVEYARHGNLRDYLRRKRPPGHVLSGSYESPSDGDHDEHETIGHDDDSTCALAVTDLLLFCSHIASGMEYLHSKKVLVRREAMTDARLSFASRSAFIVILLLATSCSPTVESVK